MSTERNVARHIAGPPCPGPDLLEQLLREEGAEFNSFPLSYGQERLWFLDQLAPHSCLYNMPIPIRITGRLNAIAVEEAFKQIVRRHEALRTTFASIGGRPLQVIAPAAALDPSLVDLSNLKGAEREEEARRLAREEARRPFNLGRGPLMRTRLLQLDREDHVLLVTLHHIISDGWSVGVLFRELKVHMESGRLDDLPIQYADYATWHRDWLKGEALEQLLGYWKKRLGGVLPVLDLPADRPRPAVQSFRGARLGLDLTPELSAALRALSRQEGVTLFVTLLAAFETLLCCYTGQQDIIVASSITNRSRPELEQLIGLFINILALRTDLSGDPSFREALRRVNETVVGAFAHQELPFEKLVAELQPARNSTYTPLTPVGFTLQYAPADDLKFAGLTLSPFKSADTITAKTDLLMYLVDLPDAISGSLEYNRELFEAHTIERMIEHFKIVLEAIVSAPEQPLSKLAARVRPKELRATSSQKQPAPGPMESSNLTRSQMLYWMGQKKRPNSPLFNMINAFIISKAIDPGHFQDALQTLINSSDAFRTVVCEVGGVPKQEVLPPFKHTLEVLDFTTAADPDGELERWLEKRRMTVLDLGRRAFESALIKLAEERFAWYINHHQLIGDGWATFLMYQRLSEFYGLSLEGRLRQAVALPQFGEYIEHERKYRQSPRFSRIDAYWRERLAEPVEPLTICGQSPERRTTRGCREHCMLGPERNEKLSQLAAREDIFVGTADLSQFSIIASLVFLYLYRISGKRRLVLRVMHHNRLTKRFAEMIGMLMESIPLRVTIEPADTFYLLLKKVSSELLRTLKHGRHTILSPSHHQVPEIALNFVNSPFGSFDGSPVAVNWIHPGSQNEILDIQVRKLDSSGELVLEFDFDADAFGAELRRLMVQYFLKLLDTVLGDVSIAVECPELILVETQTQKVLEGEAEFDFGLD